MTSVENIEGVKKEYVEDQLDEQYRKEAKATSNVEYTKNLVAARAKRDAYNYSLRPSGIGVQTDDTLDAFKLSNVLPPDADGKENLFPLSARVDGLLITLANAWGDTEGVPGSYDIFTLYVDGNPVVNVEEEIDGITYRYTNKFDYPADFSRFPGAFVVPYLSLRRGGDGLKAIHYTVVNTDTGNSNSSPQQIVTLDLIDPAEGANPDALVFVDVARNGVFDLRYLEDNDGFEVNAIRPVDHLPLDTFQIYVVGHASPLFTGNVPPGDAGDPFLVRINMATIRSGLPEGYTGKLVVRFTDRAGNRTDSSVEVDVTISMVQAPENLLAPQMASPVFIPARDQGVEGIVPPNATLRNGDTIIMLLDLNGVLARRQFSWPLDRQSFSGTDFGAIGSPLTNATLRYQVLREGAVPVDSAVATVVVDLSQLVVDPNTLTPPAAVGRPSGVPGFIQAGDTNAFWVLTPIDLTAAGHVYELWYENPTNTFTYTIVGNEAGPTIEVPIPQAFLDNGSNGTVAIGYRVRESATTGNFQDAPNGSVEVTFRTIGITTLANFTGRVGGATQEPGPGAVLGRLNCQGIEPIQNGVSLQIKEPVGILQERDAITITLTLSRDDVGDTPLPDNTLLLELVVDGTQARTGLITLSRKLLPRAFFENPAAPGSYITRGSIIAQWNVKRAAGNLDEDSPLSAVRYVLTLNGGANCLPAA